jgi:hypothetical protein
MDPDVLPVPEVNPRWWPSGPRASSPTELHHDVVDRRDGGTHRAYGLREMVVAPTRRRPAPGRRHDTLYAQQDKVGSPRSASAR